VVVVDPGGAAASVYTGLSRRDPVLPHVPAPAAPAANVASVSGTLSGAGAYPLGTSDGVDLFFLSPQVAQALTLGTGSGPHYSAPVAWDGPESTSGTLVALRLAFGAGGPSFPGYATSLVTLSRGGAVSTDLDLAPPSLTHVAGAVPSQPSVVVGYKQLEYRLAMAGAVIGLPVDESSSSAFDYAAPDLTGAGATLCVRAGSAQQLVSTEVCGIAPGATAVSVTLQAAPALVAPAAGATASPTTVFSWTPFDGGVHVLSLVTESPSQATPNLYVYTAAASATWPDLGARGMTFPDAAAYQWAVAGLGPFASIDDALGPEGLGALVPVETRVSQSQPLALTTAR
jgi:hypothetical protein